MSPNPFSRLTLGLGLGLSLLLGASAQAIDSSSGPRSETEARLLWEQGNKAWKESRALDAAVALQRFVDRYPADPHALEAHRLLGISYLDLGNAEQALVPLRVFAEATRGRDSLLEIHGWLTRAYLKLGRGSEALLSARAVRKLALKPPAHVLEKAEAFLLEARAHELLGQLKSAERGAADTQQTLARANPEDASRFPSLRYDLELLKLRLGLRRCRAFYTAARLPEDQVLNQWDRKGACVKDGIISLKTFANQPDSVGLRFAQTQAFEQIRAAWEDVEDACQNPPAPPLRPKRSAAEQNRYLSELKLVLSARCENLRNSMKSQLQSLGFSDKSSLIIGPSR